MRLSSFDWNRVYIYIEEYRELYQHGGLMEEMSIADSNNLLIRPHMFMQSTHRIREHIGDHPRQQHIFTLMVPDVVKLKASTRNVFQFATESSRYFLLLMLIIIRTIIQFLSSPLINIEMFLRPIFTLLDFHQDN